MKKQASGLHSSMFGSEDHDLGNDNEVKLSFQKNYSDGYTNGLDQVKCSMCVKNKSEAQAEIARLSAMLHELRKVSAQSSRHRVDRIELKHMALTIVVFYFLWLVHRRYSEQKVILRQIFNLCICVKLQEVQQKDKKILMDENRMAK